MVDFKKMADHSKLRKEIEQAINKHSLEKSFNEHQENLNIFDVSDSSLNSIENANKFLNSLGSYYL